MRRSLAITLILLLISTVSFAAFTPTLLKFTAPSAIQYNFDGSDFQFNFTQTGQSATTLFSVFTKGKANQITNIRNGNLGWHYVNMIDTCVYVSNATSFATGTHAIIWNGRDTDGNVVQADDYTYYLWGYDNVSTKIAVDHVIPCSWFANSKFITRDIHGIPLSKPMQFGSQSTSNFYTPAPPTLLQPVRFMKWNIGDDPIDTALVTSTFCELYVGGMNFGVNPNNYNVFFPQHYSAEVSGQMIVEKRTWVPGGEAQMDLNWGIDGAYTKATTTGDDSNSGGCYNVSDTELIMLYGCSNHTCLDDGMQFIDMATGAEGRYENMADTYVWYNASPSRLKWQNRVPTNMSLVNGRAILYEGYATPVTCVNPQGTVADGTYWLWKNLVGDGFHDNYDDNPNFATLGLSSEYTYLGAQDANWQSMQSSYDVGAVSFSMALPDGTGGGYFPFQGDVGGYKAGVNVMMDNTPYDGIYTDGTGSGGGGAGWYYIAEDSITGTLTPNVAVSETAPAAYTVAQNTPNPFNPTTTINFNIAKPGKVTVDIYNVAGQKVDTLVNGNMSAGSHSVVWNASKFSTGVYFYTVKSGSFSKTIKMTLVK
jgi:flagellar hook assembly protein FlgD